jgi:hypothetical protein
MNMETDDTDDARLLLGMVGWAHPEWVEAWFPEDLPEDWRFTYYANEASCLLLPAADWQALDAETIADWCEDAPAFFRFWLEWPAGVDPADARLAAFGEHLGGVLAEDGNALPAGLPVWRPVSEEVWRGPGGQLLVRWRIAGEDLRSLRQRLQALPAHARALVFEGVSPARLGELRTLVELLGIA